MELETDIILLVLGAAISIIPTIIMKLIDNWMNKQGKVRIYKKIVYSDLNGETWGFNNKPNGMTLMIPMWIEIYNTKKIPIVIRDFNLYVYDKGRSCIDMQQISHHAKEENILYYGDEGRYSFFVKENSIARYNLLFMLKKEDYPYDFDEIRIVYYNEKDKKIIRKLKTIEKAWLFTNNESDHEWDNI